jgi:TolB-like protein/tetratricopeptide (TPR) repeat protein
VRSEDPAEYNVPAKKPGVSPFRAISIAAIIVIAVVTWYEFRPMAPPLPQSSRSQYIDSVAVLPLDNLTGDSSYDHIGIGITEEIITHLAKIPPLKVISRHSVQAAAAQRLTTPQIANALGVRHVIEGSVKIDGDQIRVTLQHINAETDAHLWAENLGGPLSEMIQVQQTIADFVTTKIVDMIPGLTAPTMSSHLDLGPGQKAYLEGKRWMGHRTVEGINNAIHFFEASLDIDPDYAPANADLASAYALALSYRYDIDVDGYTIAARAMSLSDKAIALDPNLAAGYAARGLLGIQIGHSPEAIAADFDRAEQLSPNSASNPSWRSLAQAQLGNTEEAFAEATRAVDLDPLAPARQIALANVAFQLKRYDEAISAARIATAQEPRLIRGHAIEARSHLLNGNPEECSDLLLSAYRALRATCLEASGRPEDAGKIIAGLLDDVDEFRISEPDYTEVITFEELATYYAYIGDAKKSQEWLVRSFAASPAGIEFRVLDSELFERVRNDHDFDAAVSAIRADLYGMVRRLSETL